MILRYNKPVAESVPPPVQRKFGTGKGIIDPGAFDSVTEDEADAFIEFGL